MRSRRRKTLLPLQPRFAQAARIQENGGMKKRVTSSKKAIDLQPKSGDKPQADMTEGG
jgi:hypothetical protein